MNEEILHRKLLFDCPLFDFKNKVLILAFRMFARSNPDKDCRLHRYTEGARLIEKFL